MAAIEFKEVEKEFSRWRSDRPRIEKTNVRIEKGEFVAIIGPSGSRKEYIFNHGWWITDA